MHSTPLEPVGAVVTGLSFEPAPDDAVIDRLRDLLADHGVLVLPDQQTDDDAFAAFLSRFGALMFTAGETPVPGRTDLNVISNVGRTTPPRSSFHVDTSYVAQPPSYTALRAVTVPEEGGATLFTNQYRAWETLPDDLREAVEGRTITHVVTGVELPEGAERQADHAIVRPHPRTGRPALYLSTAARCAAVSGLDDGAAAVLVARLLDHATRPELTLRHQWRANDVVIWDNACVLHRADHSAVVGDRVLHRGMVGASGYRAAG